MADAAGGRARLRLQIPKDFEYGRSLDADLVWIHRRAGDADIYFVANQTDRPQAIEARFRVAGKEAELWHPDTGAIEPADYSIADGRTTVPLHLAPRESVFVVFSAGSQHRRGARLIRPRKR